MYVLLIVVCPFVLFRLAIVLSALRRYTNSDCPFGIFKLFTKCHCFIVLIHNMDRSIIKLFLHTIRDCSDGVVFVFTAKMSLLPYVLINISCHLPLLPQFLSSHLSDKMDALPVYRQIVLFQLFPFILLSSRNLEIIEIYISSATIETWKSGIYW